MSMTDSERIVALEGRLERVSDALAHEREMRQQAQEYVAEALRGAHERDKQHFDDLNHAKKRADEDKLAFATKRETGLRMIIAAAIATIVGPGAFELIRALIANQ